MNLSTRFFIASLALLRVAGFGGLKSQVAFSSRSLTLNSHNTPHHWPPSSPSIMHSDRTTWNEYEHEFVDPLTTHAEKGDMEHVECNPEEEDDCYWVENYFEEESALISHNKRDVADEYWLHKFKEDQDKLHHMDHTTPGQAKVKESSGIGSKDTWDHYEHEHVDHLVDQQPHEAAVKKVKDPMTEEKRALADEYWAQKSRDDKEKMAKMAGTGMDLLP